MKLNLLIVSRIMNFIEECIWWTENTSWFTMRGDNKVNGQFYLKMELLSA